MFDFFLVHLLDYAADVHVASGMIEILGISISITIFEFLLYIAVYFTRSFKFKFELFFIFY